MAAYPLTSKRLGRCLSSARNKGNMMSQNILADSGEILPIQTLRRLTQSEIDNPIEQRIRERIKK